MSRITIPSDPLYDYLRRDGFDSADLEEGHNTTRDDDLDSPAEKRKIAKVLGEFKRGTLRSSSGSKVTSRKQATAIALSEARSLSK